MEVEQTQPVEIFFSYSHKDQRLRDQLETQLSLLKREGLISNWYDHKIVAGENWQDQIDKHLNTAQIILLLISPDFIASDYCYNIEVERALERHKAGEARVIPLILRRTDWKGAPFGKLQALPEGDKPVTSWTKRDEAFFNIAQGLRKVLKEISHGPKPVLQGKEFLLASERMHPSDLLSAETNVLLTSDRILVVDDDPWLQEMLKFLLQKEGYSVAADNGENVIASIEEYKPNLILLDLFLLGPMNGFEILRYLRQKGIDIPIILMTGSRDASIYLPRGFKLGADDFIGKPFLQTELCARIEARLQKYRRS